jgi:uncharacterized membrane protein
MKTLSGDKRGVTTVFFAASAVALMAMAGLVIDVGNIFSAKRDLQGTTDLAAISAATDLTNANAAAAANAVINGYTASDVALVEPGIYTPDPNLPPASRFQPSSLASANAARVTMTHQQPLFFGNAFAMAGGNTGAAQTQQGITTQGIAVNQNTADYAIGTTVASFNGGVVNGLLTGLTGSSVSLSAIDYNNLASVNVDLFGLANALSVQLGKVGGTYGQIFSGTVPLATFLQALANAAPNAASPLLQLANAASLGSTTVDLSRLIGFGPFANLSAGQAEPNLTATASALSLIQATLQVGGAAHLINLNLGVAVPGILGATAMMTLGEPPVNSTVIAVNQVGSTIHTAQIRLLLQVSLASSVNLPVYVEVGYGTASLASLSCNALDASSTTATLNVTPGLVNGWVGSVTSAMMTNYAVEPTVAPANLVSLLGLPVLTGTANATVGNITPVPVSFSENDILNGVIKNTSTTDYLGSLVTNLLTHTSLTVVGIGVPGLPNIVTGVLAGAVSPVDQLLASVLQTAGVNLGQASTWINGAKCGAAALAG